MKRPRLLMVSMARFGAMSVARFHPIAKMAKHSKEFDVDVIPHLSGDYPDPNAYDLVYIYRLPYPDQNNTQAAIDFIEKCQNFVLDIDDNQLARLPLPEQAASREWIKNVIENAHSLRVSVPALAEILRAINPNIYVAPNMLLALPPPPNRLPGDHVNILFSGYTRDHIAPEFVDIWQEMLVKYPQICLDVIAAPHFFNTITAPNKREFGLMPHPQYQHKIAQADILWSPLADNMFTKMKSDLKFLDAAAGGASFIGSELVYGASVENEVTGMIYSSAEMMRAQIIRMIESAPLRAGLRDAAYEYVKNHRQYQRIADEDLTWLQACV